MWRSIHCGVYAADDWSRRLNDGFGQCECVESLRSRLSRVSGVWLLAQRARVRPSHRTLSPQVINGLLERDDWEDAVRIPIAALPGGSGNALACALNYYAG